MIDSFRLLDTGAGTAGESPLPMPRLETKVPNVPCATCPEPSMSSPTAPQTAQPPAPPPRWHTALVWALVVAVLVASASTVVAWRADDEVYQADILLAAFEDLPNDPERAEELATWLAEESIRSLRLDERIGDLLPLGLGVVAGPIINALEGVAVNVSTRLVQTELFAQIWARALPAVHEQLVLLAEGSDEGLLLDDGESIRIDLDEAILAMYDLIADAIPDIPDDSLFARLTGIDTVAIKQAIGDFLARALPDDLVGFPIIGEEAVDRIRTWDMQLQLILWVSLLTVIAAAAAVIMSERRRPLAIGAVAAAIVAGVGLGALLVSSLENAIVEALRNLPFDGGGPSLDTILSWWIGLIVLTLLFALVPIGTRLLNRTRPAPGRQRPSRMPG